MYQGRQQPSRIGSKKRPPLGWPFHLMAEREGFEPSIRCRIHTFQACAFDHSATSPWARSLAQPYPLDEQVASQKEVPSSILK